MGDAAKKLEDGASGAGVPASAVQALVFVSAEDNTLLSGVKTDLVIEAGPNVQFHEVRDFATAMAIVKTAGRAVVVCAVSTPAELKSLGQLTVDLGYELKTGLLEILVTSESDHRLLPVLVQKIGCDEFVQPDIDRTTFRLLILRSLSSTEHVYGSFAERDQKKSVTRRARNPVLEKFLQEKAAAVTELAETFELVKDRAVRDAYLAEAADHSSALAIWTEDRQVKISCLAKKYSEDLTKLELPYPEKYPSREALGYMFRKHKSTRLIFSIRLRRACLFFRVDTAKIEFFGESLLVNVPDDLYVMQRRSNFRFEVPESESFEVQLFFSTGEKGLQSFVRARVTDISAGGLAFYGERAAFRKALKAIGQELPQIRFQLDGVDFSCGATLQWMAMGKARIKGGLMFRNLSPYDRETIDMFVLQQSLGYLQKYAK